MRCWLDPGLIPCPGLTFHSLQSTSSPSSVQSHRTLLREGGLNFTPNLQKKKLRLRLYGNHSCQCTTQLSLGRDLCEYSATKSRDLPITPQCPLPMGLSLCPISSSMPWASPSSPQGNPTSRVDDMVTISVVVMVSQVCTYRRIVHLICMKFTVCQLCIPP